MYRPVINARRNIAILTQCCRQLPSSHLFGSAGWLLCTERGFLIRPNTGLLQFLATLRVSHPRPCTQSADAYNMHLHVIHTHTHTHTHTCTSSNPVYIHFSGLFRNKSISWQPPDATSPFFVSDGVGGI